MIKNVRAVAVPLLSLAFIVLAAAYFSTYSTLQMKQLGLSDHYIGLTHSGYYAGMLLSSFVCQAIVERIGHARSFVLASTLIAFSMLFMGFFGDQWNWMAMRCLAGGCMGLIYIVVESWLLACSSVVNRGQILALYTVALYTAQAFGQYFIDFIPANDNFPCLVAAMLTLLGVLPYLLETRSVNANSESEDTSWLEITLQAPYGVIGSAISGVILGSIYSFAPLFAEEFNLSTSMLMSVTIFGGVFLQWPLGRLSDIFNRQTVLIATCLSMLIPCISIYLMPDNLWSVLANSFLLGGLAFTIYPQSIALVTVEAPKASFTSATSVVLLTYGIGSMLGPLIVPYFTTLYDTSVLFLFILSLGVVFGVGGIIKAMFENSDWAISEPAD